MRVLIFAFTLFLVSCSGSTTFDREKETEAILRLHNLQRDYHFNKDSVAFVNQLSENFISVNKGEVSRPTKQEMLSRYSSYFSSVEFIKWDDVTEPIIKFSEDGTMAYTVVDKIVTVKYQDETAEGETHFAWTAIYKKYGSEWKIDCVTSTEK